MEPNQPLSFSRLGPMDPRQVRYEFAEELATPVRPDGKGGRSRREKGRKPAKRGGGE